MSDRCRHTVAGRVDAQYSRRAHHESLGRSGELVFENMFHGFRDLLGTDPSDVGRRIISPTANWRGSHSRLPKKAVLLTYAVRANRHVNRLLDRITNARTGPTYSPMHSKTPN